MKVKGSVLLSRRVFVHKHFGEAAWEQVLAGLPAEDRGALGGMLLSVGWFDFKLGERLDAAIVRILGKGDERVFEKIGETSADENLTGVHKHFLAPGNPQKFLAQAGDIYRFYYNTGHRTYEPTGPTAGVLTTYEATTFSRLDCLTVVGWYRRALEMCGAREVRVREDSCRARGGEFCRYRVEWTA